ncbi:MAG: hypothetical protein JNM57_11430 [Cyclobacteriaceae bacterium]|nr:hypothetical protein [Cyclobacteriaceae bacterium]
MDKYHFNSLLQRLSNSSVEDAQTILTLKSDFPYSQLLHALSARVSKDHSLSQQQLELQLAAVYANDRAVLKEIMTKSFSEELIVENYQDVKEYVKGELKETKSLTQETDIQESSTDLADELIHDLEKLHESRLKFEMLFGGVEAPTNTTLEKIQGTEDPHGRKSKKERIKELARAIQNKPEEPLKTETGQKPKKQQPQVDSLIEEIKTTKEEIIPAGEKQKEQLHIIEQFIKIQPSIVNTKEKQAAIPPGDLSTIKSGEFSDNIVSETLVEILLKQGKKEKAVEVLKKLIWKFPQKKAYFAAQIEELKK